MAKGVLGNDPFQRGAASRDGEPAGGAKDADSASTRSGRKAAAKKSAPAKQSSRVKEGGGKAASASGKKPVAAKADGSAGKGRKAPASRERKPAAGGSAPRPSDSARMTEEEPGLPLREPAAPVTPRRPPPARKPVLSDEAGARTPKQREVDHALAEALAAEVAEATAKVAVDEALERQHGQGPEADVDRLMATELATELAEAAVEEVLDHSPSTQRPERERELAATVAAQVAEAAAEVVVAEVLDRHAAAQARGSAEDFDDEASESPDGDEDGEGLEPDGAYDLEAEAEGGFGPAGDDERDDEEDEDDAEDSTWDTSGMELSVTLSVTEASGDGDTSGLEPEVEVPDATRDEFPPGRRGPLSLVPPPHASETPSEPFFTEQVREPEAPRPLAQRAAGMLSLARDIAGQALASEGLGRAMGAMNGLMGAVRAGLGTGGGASIDEYGKDPSLVERLDPVLEFLYSQYWRVAVQGVDHVPRGAAILVANHSGALPYDGLVMSLVISRERPDLREARWLVEDQVFHAPVLGTLFNRLGAVRACPENALRLLDEQRPLVVFPEGYQALSKPFAERYKLKRFGRGGFVKLALRTGAPIVPVAIVGAEETSPLLGRLPASFLGLPFVPLTPLGPLPLPAKWSIRFGEPMSMDGLSPEAAEDLGEVQRLTERTRESIQGMLQSLLRERRSVFAG
ncbi:lysophospholipid acyltransferase family protein [Pyxidicoccus xibeiensis]|uniref:lysophospholipid acyltransferase family protein n=1 Tax=Pyxidicoccus xibeiensis TaxID=2906759 RepID=UPI0020A6EE9C|nr:lysophospholipid acyltransferase family protein [Pyxidicoccus xibeiensis]MCP3138003.1 acyltransferase family protein [Pyxidicoccus xibeiensis]